MILTEVLGLQVAASNMLLVVVYGSNNETSTSFQAWNYENDSGGTPVLDTNGGRRFSANSLQTRHREFLVAEVTVHYPTVVLHCTCQW